MSINLTLKDRVQRISKSTKANAEKKSIQIKETVAAHTPSLPSKPKSIDERRKAARKEMKDIIDDRSALMDQWLANEQLQADYPDPEDFLNDRHGLITLAVKYGFDPTESDSALARISVKQNERMIELLEQIIEKLDEE